MKPLYVHFERIIGKPVRDSEGTIVGRLEDARAEKRGDEYVITSYLIGVWGLLERLSLTRLHVPFHAGGYRARWDQLDLSDPEHPRLTCKRGDLVREDHGRRGSGARHAAKAALLALVLGAHAAHAAHAKPQAPAPSNDWALPAHDPQGTRFSPLTQITAANVSGMKPAWTFATGVRRGQEAAPIVAGSTMYVVTPFPNTIFALDLKRAGTPNVVKWKFTPKPVPASQGVACCDVVNRGAAYAGGRVFFNTLDGRTFGLDGASGRVIWQATVADIQKGETITMAPLVVGSRVFVGNSGGEFGVRGWLKALDAASGRVLWTAYSTGPDSEVLIGPSFHPFYPQDRGKDLGVKTWPPNQWQIGGGTVWGWLTYDPEMNLLYYGTANPGAWNPDVRSGDNKWTCGVFARDPATGQAKWFYQCSPHDLYDYDGVNESIVADIAVNGVVKRVLLHPERNGYVYVLDRATGRVITAQPFVRVTTSKGVDVQTGKLLYAAEKKPETGRVIRDVAPASPGSKDWQPSAYSPRTGLLYIPHQTLAMDYEGTDVNYVEGTPYVGANVKMYPDPVSPGGGTRGMFTAWDPVASRARWKIVERFPVWSGALVTAGDVVFYGTMDGWFKAVDAKDGRLLWKFKTDSGIIGQPTTFVGPDGKQYVAVLAGVGGWSGAIVAAGLDYRDKTAGGGFVHAMTDLPRYTDKGDKLYVFALP